MTNREIWAAAWALVLATLCHAGPVNRQASNHNALHLDVGNQSYAEQNGVCVSDDVLYQPGDAMPAPTPCARCVCRPPAGLCTPVACEQRAGCKAVQRPDQCCPEYQCECESNGRVYANGERLDDADEPCQVCYCRGGEVVCAAVECYRRDDCEPLYVPGRCCPKYDHCPPLVMDDERLGARPQHPRAGFQPSGGFDDEDQLLGASSVQERVHHAPAAAIDIAVPAVPWTEAPAASPGTEVLPAAAATTAARDPADDGSATAAPTGPSLGSPLTARPPVDSPDADVNPPENSATLTTAVILTETHNDPTEIVVVNIESMDAQPDATTTENVSETGAKKEMKEQPTETAKMSSEEAATEGTTAETFVPAKEKEPLTRLFMLSKEADLDPTTVSVEYADTPEEMSTTPEATDPKQPTTIEDGKILTTETITEVTNPAQETSTPESYTDVSPEIKDFDEWSGSKSSEFLRDGASSGSFGSSSPGAHSKVSSSEEASHFLPTNIDAAAVKPSESFTEGSFEGSTADSTEDSSKESATTEHPSSTEVHSGHTDTRSNVRVADRINEHTIGKGASKDEGEEQKKGNEKQPDIVLDTEATDGNGPPILLIGDDLANHQMDIVVATSSTEESDTEGSGAHRESELREKNQESVLHSDKTSDVATEAVTEIITEETPLVTIHTEKVISSDASTEKATVTPETETYAAVAKRGSVVEEEGITEASSADTLDAGMEMSDSPISGQKAEVIRNEEITAAKGEKIGVENSEFSLNTVFVEEATSIPVDSGTKDIPTERTESESTTSIALEVEQTEKIEVNEMKTEPSNTESPREELADSQTETIGEDRASEKLSAESEQEITLTTEHTTEEDTKVTENPITIKDEKNNGNENKPTDINVRAHVLDTIKQFSEQNLTDVIKTENEKDNSSGVIHQVNNTNIVNEEIMLGDQSQSGSRLQSTVSKIAMEGIKHSKDESKENIPTESKQEEEKVIKDASPAEETLSLLPTHISNTSVVRQNSKLTNDNTESVNTTNSSELTETTPFDTNDETTPPWDKTTTQILTFSELNENQGKKEESSEKNTENLEMSDEEMSTLRTDAASSVPENVPDATPATDSPLATTDSPSLTTTGEDGVNINLYVLDLKPPAAPPAAESQANATATGAPVDSDGTTLSPSWLKADNESSGTEKEVHDAKEVTEAEAAETTEAAQEAAASAAGAAGEAGEAAAKGGGQLPERRGDDADKRHLFLLEDFFAKLYRHQIATDSAKAH